MKAELLMQIITAVLYIAVSVYFSHKHRQLLRKERLLLQKERETYAQVFTNTMDLFSERYVRHVQRTQVLHVSDWAYARRTHGELMGLAYILPGVVMESAEPIDITKYFTDDEAEAVISGLEVFRKDKRTAHLCDHFVYRG